MADTKEERQRDEKGRFLKGHKVIGNGMQKAIQFNKEHRVWNFNKKLGLQSEEVKNKKRITMIERWKSPTWDILKRGSKISISKLGKKRSDETKDKIRRKLLGHKQSKQAIEKSALKHRGIPSKQKGVKRSEDFKRKVGIGLHNAYLNGKRKGLYIKESKPEKKLKEELINKQIIFTQQKAIYGTPDFFIEPNVCIFVDGDYWHNIPKVKERDIKVNDYLSKNGYKIFRFWENEIYSDINKIVQTIKNG